MVSERHYRRPLSRDRTLFRPPDQSDFDLHHRRVLQPRPAVQIFLALSPPTSSRSMEQSKASATVNVDAVAVESMTDDSAVVIVAARSDLTNPDNTKRDPESWRISITLKRDGGQLKISMVEFVQ